MCLIDIRETAELSSWNGGNCTSRWRENPASTGVLLRKSDATPESTNRDEDDLDSDRSCFPPFCDMEFLNDGTVTSYDPRLDVILLLDEATEMGDVERFDIVELVGSVNG